MSCPKYIFSVWKVVRIATNAQEHRLLYILSCLCTFLLDAMIDFLVIWLLTSMLRPCSHHICLVIHAETLIVITFSFLDGFPCTSFTQTWTFFHHEPMVIECSQALDKHKLSNSLWKILALFVKRYGSNRKKLVLLASNGQRKCIIMIQFNSKSFVVQWIIMKVKC